LSNDAPDYVPDIIRHKKCPRFIRRHADGPAIGFLIGVTQKAAQHIDGIAIWLPVFERDEIPRTMLADKGSSRRRRWKFAPCGKRRAK
jgi:hypothetical protein